MEPETMIAKDLLSTLEVLGLDFHKFHLALLRQSGEARDKEARNIGGGVREQLIPDEYLREYFHGKGW